MIYTFEARFRTRGVQTAILFTVLTLTLCCKSKVAAGSLLAEHGSMEDNYGQLQGVVTTLAQFPEGSCNGSSVYICSLRQWWTHHVRTQLGDDSQQIWPEFEFNWSLLVGTIVGMVGSIFGSVGGIGGAPFYLPMLNFVIGFDAKTTTAVSKAMVMGSSIASVAFNFGEKHPTETRPVIDYDMSMLFQPMILLGISIGVLLNVVLPEWFVTVLLVILFWKLFLTTSRRAVKMWKQETDSRNLERSVNSESDPQNDYISIPAETEHVRNAEQPVTWQWVPRRRMAILVGTWLIFLALQIAKVYIQDCSLWYWVATFVQVPLAFGVTIREAFLQEKGESANEEATCTGTEEKMEVEKWTTRLLYSLFGLIAGLTGGLLGVGGGGIMGPAFLHLGLVPQVASATASFIMVFSSALSVGEFYLLGRLPTDFAIYFTVIAIIASALGQAVIKKIILRTGKVSIIVFVLAGCLVLAGLVLGFSGATSSYYRWESGAGMGFRSLCDDS